MRLLFPFNKKQEYYTSFHYTFISLLLKKNEFCLKKLSKKKLCHYATLTTVNNFSLNPEIQRCNRPPPPVVWGVVRPRRVRSILPSSRRPQRVVSASRRRRRQWMTSQDDHALYHHPRSKSPPPSRLKFILIVVKSGCRWGVFNEGVVEFGLVMVLNGLSCEE